MQLLGLFAALDLEFRVWGLGVLGEKFGGLVGMCFGMTAPRAGPAGFVALRRVVK